MHTRIALNDSRIRIRDATGKIAKGSNAESDENREIGTLGTGTMLPSLRHMRKKERAGTVCQHQCPREKIWVLCSSPRNVRIGLEIQTTGNAWEEMGNPESEWSSLVISRTCSERAGSMDPPIHLHARISRWAQ